MHLQSRKLLSSIDFLIAYIAVAGLVGVTILGVVMRYFLSSPLTWLEEVQMMLIVWLVMFGGSAAFRLNHHIAIDAIVLMLSPGLQRGLEWVVALIVVAVLGFLVWAGSLFVAFQFRADRVTEVLGIPYGWIYLALPIGGVFMILSYLASSVIPLIRGCPSYHDGGNHA